MNEIQVPLQLINIFLAIHPANVYVFVYEIHENFCSNDIHSVIDNCISSVPIDLIFQEPLFSIACSEQNNSVRVMGRTCLQVGNPVTTG